MALLLEVNLDEWMTNEALYKQLSPLLPDADIRVAPDYGERADIKMVACVSLAAGLVNTLPNLQLIQKLGAGVESIVADPTVPQQVKIARLRADAAAHEIAEYCVAYVLQQQRNMRFHADNQAKGEWVALAPKISAETTIGVLGLGNIGAHTASVFATLGYRVLGWSRTPKTIANVDSRAGAYALEPMLEECDYVISILPSTPQTHHLFNAELFEAMKRGVTIINAGRGSLINDADLIAALDSGQVGHAILDVFHTEPLPDDHPFWQHPGVTVTPHVSGWHLGDALNVVADNYRRVMAGEPLLNLVNREQGY